MEFPVEYPKCPSCKKEGTLYLQAVKDDPSPPKKVHSFLEKKLSPVQDFMSISLPTVRVLVRHYDTCSNCGMERCIRAEVLPMPTDILMQAMGLVGKLPGRK